MKKLRIGMGILLCAAGLLACGAEGKDFSLHEANISKYLTLGDYRNLQITEVSPEVTDEDVDADIADILANIADPSIGKTTGVAKLGDTVNIDYEGKRDGVAFEGGTAQKYTLGPLGASGFIDGFDDSVVGMQPGETKDAPMTFPEDYRSEELKGADVVFTITLNYILPSPDELTDAQASLVYDGASTMEEAREAIRSELLEVAKENYDAEIENDIAAAVVDASAFKSLPESLSQKYQARLINQYTQVAQVYGLDLQTYVGAMFGIDLESFSAEAKEWGAESARQALAYQAIANEQGLNPTEEEIDAYMTETATAQGYDSADAMLEAGATRDDFRDALMMQRVGEYLKGIVTITEE